MALSRRKLLASLGGAGAVAALSPFVPLFQAEAQDGAPKRLLIFQTSMGMGSLYPGNWHPQDGNTALRIASDSILAPLRGLEDRLLVMNGIDMQSARDMRLPGGHPLGLGNLLTGTKLVTGSGGLVGGGDRDWRAVTGGPSVDQYIASELGARSLELAVSTSPRASATYKTRMSFRSPTEPITPEYDASAMLERLWGGGVPGGDNDAAERRQRAMFDHIHQELSTVVGRASGEDRDKIRTHLSALEAVQAEIGGVAGATCMTPSLGDQSTIPQQLSAQMRLITAAFSCNIAQVASIMVGGYAPHGWRFDWLPGGRMDAFHGLSHRGPSDTNAQMDMNRALTWYSEQFRDLIQMLDAVPEGDGTMLDNTTVLWCTEMSRGDTHDHRNMPFIIAGGSHYFNTGRYLNFNGEPHNGLLISLCHSMGLEVDRFGDPEYASGPLARLAT